MTSPVDRAAQRPLTRAAEHCNGSNMSFSFLVSVPIFMSWRPVLLFVSSISEKYEVIRECVMGTFLHTNLSSSHLLTPCTIRLPSNSQCLS